MTLQYRAVYDHLAEGAERLSPEGSASLAAGTRAVLLPAGAPAEVPEPERVPAASAPAAAAEPIEVARVEPAATEAPVAPLRPEPAESKRILFLCSGNSCRSQMAEGFARASAPAGLLVYSAGTKPEGLNPGAIAAMAETGIDISRQRSKGLSEVPLEDIDVVVTLCAEAAEQCPAFPGTVERFHWPLRDPAKATGTEEEVTRVFHEVRDEIEERVLALFERLGLPTEIARVEPARTL
jgi:arsenate reductase